MLALMSSNVFLISGMSVDQLNYCYYYYTTATIAATTTTTTTTTTTMTTTTTNRYCQFPAEGRNKTHLT
jgi:hypothetical protein